MLRFEGFEGVRVLWVQGFIGAISRWMTRNIVLGFKGLRIVSGASGVGCDTVMDSYFIASSEAWRI